MRDPKRIDIVMKRLKALWKKNPDLRLCQLVINVSGVYDPFYMEDEDFVLKMVEYGHMTYVKKDNKNGG